MTFNKSKLLIILLSSVLFFMENESFAKENEMITLKLIGQNGSVIETITVDKNKEKIAITMKNLLKIEGLENLSLLSEVNLTHCLINSIEWIPKRIKKLILYFNKLKNLDSIEKFISLEEIYLDDNKIEKIDGIFSLKKLKIAEFAGNNIEIINCSENNTLEKILLNSNNIKKIHNLNLLRKLSYLALSDNPIESNKTLIAKLRKENPGVEITVRDKIKDK